MRPAFASTKSAAAFALLLLALLALPAVIGKSLLPPREQAYATLGWGTGPYPWIRHEIFEETNDIDIAFLGSSHMVKGIDTAYVQQALGNELGRPAVVRTIAWGGAGYDVLYFIAQDLLAHRRVKLLVFYDENTGGNLRNPAATAWFRFGENGPALTGLPFRDQAMFYCASLIGMPRSLLGLIRPNRPAAMLPGEPGYIEPHDHAFSDAPTRLGAVASQLGYNANPLFQDNAPFEFFQPVTTNTIRPSIYTAANPSTDFEFLDSPLDSWELHFAGRFGRLAASHDCQLVLLQIPTLNSALDNVLGDTIRERTFWPAVFPTNTVFLGIPERKLFAGLTDAEIKKLFSDKDHLNLNGMEFFTPLITPALINLYESQSSH